MDAFMTRRRRRIVLALLVVLVLLGVGGWLMFGPVTIRQGMARDEIEALLGPPDGNMLAIGNRPVEATTLVWKDRGIVIEFDDTERVRTVTQSPSLFDNLRRMLGL